MKNNVGDVIRKRPLSEEVRAYVDHKDTSAALIARADDAFVVDARMIIG